MYVAKSPRSLVRNREPIEDAATHETDNMERMKRAA
jgi:hypothetical protein